jgi:CDP-glucose 4,6-dehydratase
VSGIDPQFWRGRKVLLTGHTGFKGTWLSLWLQDLGAAVTGLSLGVPTTPSLHALSDAANGLAGESLIDIRDLDGVRSAVAVAQPEIVLHLAAQPIVRRSVADPVVTYATNVMGTVHVLEAARSAPSVRVIVNVTSDKCYENREWVWGYREDEAMGGSDPYSSSKGAAELVTAAYRRTYFADPDGPRLASARAGNVIGGGDWGEDRLVPDIARSATAGVPAPIRNPGSVRPWQHVMNPLSGYLLLAERLWTDATLAEGWNFGPDDDGALSVGDLATRLTQLWGDGAAWAQDGERHPHEATYLRLDSSKARQRLGWEPRWNVDVALERTAAWYRGYRAQADVRELTLEQIRAYSAA